MQGTASAFAPQSEVKTIEQCFAGCLKYNFCDFGFTWDSNGVSGHQCLFSGDGVYEVADQPGRTFYRCIKGALSMHLRMNNIAETRSHFLR